MSERSRRDRERELDAALAGFGSAGESDDPDRAEIDRLASLAGELRRFGRSVPTIDENMVWLQIRAGMLAEPQRRPAGLWGRLWAAFGWIPATPRLVLASTVLAVALGVALSAWALQPSGSASAAFLHRVDEIAVASAAAAERIEVSPEERAAIEREAFALLTLASRPGVLSGLRSTDANAVRDRLIEARGALASILAEDPKEARAIAALAAISGLLEPGGDVPGGLEATAPSTPTPTVEATATPSPTPSAVTSATPQATATATATAMATATATPTAAKSTSTPTASPTPPRATATVSTPTSTPTATSTKTPTPEPTVAIAGVQSSCARVVDQSSLAKCAEAGAAAARTCTGDGARACRRSIEEIVDTAEHRLDRVREGCRELPSSKARDACNEATRSERRRSGSEYEGDTSPAADATSTSGKSPRQGGANTGRD